MDLKNRIGNFRQPDVPVGYLLSSEDVRIPIKTLRLDRSEDWWGGSVRLINGATIETGIYRLVMNDGRRADLSVDEITRGRHFGMVSAVFHGIWCGAVALA